MNATRWLATLGTALIGAGLAIQLLLTIRNMTGEGATPIEAVWRYFGYFTILTNVLVFSVLLRAALKPASREKINAPHVELMGVTSISFVGVVYHALLASRWDPQGWQKVADVLLHTASPLMFVLFWLARPHGGLTWRDALFCALWPSAYAAYGLTRGAADGFYAYYFMDPNELSWPALALNVAGLSFAFVVGAFLYLALDGALARRSAP
jgi:hypothetical protein